MAVLGYFNKQPAEVLDYLIDFNPWLEDRGDTIATYQVTAPTGITINNVTHSAGVVRFFASGGTDRQSYKATCTVTTASSPARTKQVEVMIRVREQ